MMELPRTESSSEYLNRISREYSLYVIDQRAIPSITDGLKSAQRIALWLIRDVATDMKTHAFVGRMSESGLYVHGDASASETVSRLAAPYRNNNPLVEKRGAFGTKISPNTFGAPRYTFVKRAKFAEQYVYQDMDIIPMRENYDSSRLMPATFLPLIPLVLLNGVKGIAVGWSTNILPRKLSDIKKAVLEQITTGEIKTSLNPYYRNYDVRIIRDRMEPNKYEIHGRVEKVDSNTVRITELPPGRALEKLRETLIDLEDEKKITDFIDNSRDQINVLVKFRRADLAEMTDEALIRMFKLREVEHERIVVLDAQQSHVRQYDSPQEVIRDFVEWRLSWYKTRYEFMIRHAQEEELFWSCLKACFQDNLPNQIGKFTTKSDLKDKIEVIIRKAKLEAVPEIVEKISILPTYRWTKEGEKECEKNIKRLRSEIIEYEKIVSSPKRMKSIFQEEVAALVV